MIHLWAIAPQELQLLKVNIIDATGLGKDALHVYAGLTLFILVRLIWRWRGGWLLAWLAVLALAGFIEWLDMRAGGGVAEWKPDAKHWHDIWNTMFWPSVLLLVGRWLQPRPGRNALRSSDLADQSLEQPPSV